mmetsp:Transcript_3728/g.6357  ORF Transcript_3728/g.6357 Transcript_3728/m.6357 type:complete len:121 (-) Transcript_3728:121-483(-)|eukprot:CAMPEP_0168609514 /NCGR_PEP_ID=MMETSP0449_2-20121227/1252_1 /TAXON_ID=1082188 /ORGANISM="Strombidium rassoulzadegani, Strain ras09" /LENGTH=120 /DNA_ID=CAMNT_0008649673 /DNA_START=211 /DNA_END=573 /DNA_ORIENTATION=+
MATGGIASFFGTPADLILVRIQGDKSLPVEHRRNYSSFLNAAQRVKAEEGFLSLWKGLTPTFFKAIFFNLGMFTSYEQAKEMLSESYPLRHQSVQIVASIISGTTAACFSLPFDNAKTKL